MRRKIGMPKRFEIKDEGAAQGHVDGGMECHVMKMLTRKARKSLPRREKEFTGKEMEFTGKPKSKEGEVTRGRMKRQAKGGLWD